MFTINYSRTAILDLDAIFSFIALDCVEVAENYMNELEIYLLKLAEFPYLGKLSRKRYLPNRNVREIYYDKYIICYTVEEHNDSIYILRVLHSSRDSNKFLISE